MRISLLIILGFTFSSLSLAHADSAEDERTSATQHTQHPPHDHPDNDHIKKLDEGLSRRHRKGYRKSRDIH